MQWRLQLIDKKTQNQKQTKKHTLLVQQNKPICHKYVKLHLCPQYLFLILLAFKFFTNLIKNDLSVFSIFIFPDYWHSWMLFHIFIGSLHFFSFDTSVQISVVFFYVDLKDLCIYSEYASFGYHVWGKLFPQPITCILILFTVFYCMEILISLFLYAFIFLPYSIIGHKHILHFFQYF